MTIQELSKREVELSRYIQGCEMWDTSGRTVDEIASVVADKYDAMRELAEVKAKIREYLEGAENTAI